MQFVIKLKGDSLNLYSPQCKFVLSIWLCFVINLHFELCNDEELSTFNFKPVGGNRVYEKENPSCCACVICHELFFCG
jgi:hypothetical protein